MDVFLWVIVPYLCLATFVVGHFWRYRYDKFGWTTRSSQLYENRLLRIGSPLFHFGMLGVVGGHIVGLLVPHVLRPFAGHRPGLLLPASALAGAVFLLVADTGLRLVQPWMELRIGVLTALIGAPFFVWLVLKTRSELAP